MNIKSLAYHICDHTNDFEGHNYEIADTARRFVGIVHHPGSRFWVVEPLSSGTSPSETLSSFEPSPTPGEILVAMGGGGL